MERETRYRFETNLEREDVSVLGSLIGLNHGPHQSDRNLPFISTILFFRTIGANQVLPWHDAEAGLVLIQENLAIEIRRALLPDRPMIVDARVTVMPGGKLQVDAEILDGEGMHLARTTATARSVTTEQIARLQEIPLHSVTRGAKLSTFLTAAVSGEVVDRYVALAGDDNPIHTDPDYARQAGFPGPVLPGALVAGFAQQAVADFFPWLNLLDIRVRFVAAIPVGEQVAISIQERHPATAEADGKLRLFFHRISGGVSMVADARVGSE